MDKPLKIFYSWQTSSPKTTNRNFIESALKTAIKNLSKDSTLKVVFELDKDTAGLVGSPDIQEAILSKIAVSDIFVADLTIVTKTDKESFPNPNVLFEYGYALSKLTPKRIITILNTAFGEIKALPFDITRYRATTYSLAEGGEKPEARKELVTKLEVAIKSIYLEIQKEKNTYPGLEDSDVKLFKELCKTAIERNSYRVSFSRNTLKANLQLSDDDLDASKTILVSNDYIKLIRSEYTDSVRLEILFDGFTKFAQREFDYMDFRKKIGEHLAKEKFYSRRSDNIAIELGIEHFIVEHILQEFEKNKWINLAKNSYEEWYAVRSIDPSIKRFFS